LATAPQNLRARRQNYQQIILAKAALLN
jgi:hypothetical protein